MLTATEVKAARALLNGPTAPLQATAAHIGGMCTVADLQRLRDKKWLNDTILNLFLETLSTEGHDIRDSFWFPYIKHTRPLQKPLLAPVHVRDHWVLLHCTNDTVTVYDSYKTHGVDHTAIWTQVQKALPQAVLVIADCPQQHNTTDCGVHVAAMAMCLTMGTPLTVPVDMREYMLQCLMR
jgi:Ulp1 family protease